ncbi:MAG: ABC transporter permease, partial [Bacteroidetes bacterium]|nr:ABC transporter permease [Bacteroidota bacterium]
MNPYTFHISLYDVAFLGVIFIGLTFSLLLWFKNGINKAAHRFLSIALCIVVLWTARILAIDVWLETYFSGWGWLPLQFSLAFGPLLFFYVLKITRPEYKFRRKDLLHFSPLLLELGAWVLEVKESVSTGNVPYNTAVFHRLNPFILILTFISVSIYLYLSHRQIKGFYRQIKFTGGDRYRFELRWLQNLLKVFGLLWLWCIPVAVINYWGHDNHAFYFMYLLVAAMTIWIAAAVHLKAETGIHAEMPSFPKPLPASELKQKVAWLKKTVKENGYYKDPELSLGTLAEKLGLHTHELSRILNTVLKKSFSDFINEYRVREVIRKMPDPAYDHITLLGIAYESGFNAQSTFSRIFKQITGKSPAEYKNELKKDYPTYNSRSYDRFAAATLPMKSNRYGMFKNYLKIAWRNLVRQRLYSVINIAGLAVGLAVCMLIMLYVVHEHNYDRFHKNADRIIKPYGEVKIGDNKFDMDQMSYASGPIIKQSLPAVEDYMRTLSYFQSVVVSNPSQTDQKFSEKKLLFADAGFFNFFSFKLLSGRPSQVLSKPFSVVISQDMAKKYFGDENPVGRTLLIKTDSAYTYQVTGVAENCPSNSSIEYNFVASNSGFVKTKEAKIFLGDPKWGNGTFDVYLLLRRLADTSALRRSIQSISSDKNDKVKTTFVLSPLTDRHLTRSRDDANIKYLTIFPFVALLILLLALVNYMSLSTARSTLRAKEIGVRKVSGASRKSVALQFYIESAVFSTIAFLLGYVLCYLFKPVFFDILQLKIDSSFLYSPLILSLLFGLWLVTILVSGSYPSLVLSGFKPAITLKGKMSKQAGGVTVRKVFTTLQFAISVALIICGVVIDRQLYFFRHTDTGVDRDNVIMIPIGGTFKNYAAFNHDITTLAGVSNVATSRYGMFSYMDMYGIQGKTKDETIMLPSLAVDQNFFGLLGLKWKYPPLTHDNAGLANKVVLNELAVEKLHLSQNPVGSYIKPGPQNVEVAGVVKNFNFNSLEDAIQPLGLWVLPDTSRFWKMGPGCYLFAKIKSHTNLPTLLGAMENIYKKYDADTPFDYTFMDDAFNARYKAEDRLASIFSIFTVLTIALAAMGLFGLAAFTIEQRTKEIGIRKVLGA